MWRARVTDGTWLFQSSEFLATSQIASFFWRQSNSVGQRNPDEADIQAAQRESQFTEAKEPLVHPHRVKYYPFFTAINVLLKKSFQRGLIFAVNFLPRFQIFANFVFENSLPEFLWEKYKQFTKMVVDERFSILTGSHS